MMTKTDRRAAKRERKRYGHKTKIGGKYAADINRRRQAGELPPAPLSRKQLPRELRRG